MAVKKYYILDNSGIYITSYSTTLEASEKFETTPNVFTIACNNISKILRGQEPKNGTIYVKGLVCVKKEDYHHYREEIVWILTKSDILVINSKGKIIGTYKTLADAVKAIHIGDYTNVANATRVLNVRDREAYGYRLATREHYINMVKDDPLYYMRCYDNSGTKVSVDMYNYNTGEYVRNFESLTEAGDYMGCTKECIRQSTLDGRAILGTEYYFKRKEV